MKSEDVVILHLSDLHIGEAGLRQVHFDLLEDVAHQISEVKLLVIAVTGDIVDQGRVEEAYQAVVEFFRKLKAKIPSECIICSLEITPGNHDYKRPDLGNKFNDGSYRPDTAEFELLLADVYKEFGFNYAGRYGLSVIEYDCCKLCFARIDSSWYETDENIKNRMEEDCPDKEILEARITGMKNVLKVEAETQREDIIQKWVQNFGLQSKNAPFLTFVISHLPFTWMGETNNGDVRRFLSGQGIASIDFWLCGHLHSAKIRYVRDNGFQMTTLMSGIGNAEMSGDSQRYSIYRLALERNTCTVQIRVSCDEGGFRDDLNMEREGVNNNCGHIVLPLKSETSTSALVLNSATNAFARACFLDSNMLKCIKTTQNTMLEIERCIQRRISFLHCFIRDQLDIKFPDRSEGTNDWLKNGLTEVTKDFVSYILELVKRENLLYDLLTNISADIFYQLSVSPDCTRTRTVEPIWRVHFRGFREQTSALGEVDYEYQAFAVSSDDAGGERLKNVKAVKWSGVLEASYKHPEKTLVNSANPGLNVTETEWDDFMTTIPIPEINSFTFAKRRSGGAGMLKTSRPIFSFGISVMADDFVTRQEASRILYLFEFFDLNGILSNALRKFLRKIGCHESRILKELVSACLTTGKNKK